MCVLTEWIDPDQRARCRPERCADCRRSRAAPSQALALGPTATRTAEAKPHAPVRGRDRAA